MESIIINDFRIQILDKNLIRIEKKYNGSFEDNNTFFVPNRDKYNGYKYSLSENNNCTTIEVNSYFLSIINNKITLKDKNGKTIYRYKYIENSGELPSVYETPRVYVLNDAPHIIIPSDGYSIKSFNKNEKYVVNENKIDIYLFIVEKDYKLLRKMYVELTGRSELVRMQTLGLWNSRYYKYRDEDVYNLINDYKKYNIPLDNFVIDTDWRKANDIGIGYEIDTVLFPNMKNVFDYAHERNIAIMFNDHPEPVEKVCNVFDYKEIEFREINLKKLLDLGLDMWWYDRNWSTKLISPTKKIEPETFGLYLFNDVTRQHYKNRDGKYYTRPDIMGNVNNILHGFYYSINDSASHRYSIQWTGDITYDAGSITREVFNLIRGSENEITYINFDVGGHIGNPNSELYLRWMQFATFTPIMRPHCTNYVERFREPWNYDKKTLDICREYINMHYRLLGYIYSYAHNNYETGEPLVKSLSYLYPNNKKIRDVYDTYILGNNIMVSPLGERVNKIVEKNRYTKPVKAIYYNNVNLEGDPIKISEYNELNIVLNHNSPEKEVPIYNFSALFETSIKFNEDVLFYVKNDDGVRVYINGELKLEDWKGHGVIENFVCKLDANVEYDIKIEYYQGAGEAAIQLSYSSCRKEIKTINIPGDKWIDVFNGKIYSRKFIYINKLIKRMPIYVKEGSLIPLLKAKNNTSELTFDELIFEYYPSRNVKDSGYIYEDDRKTIAYQYNIYRKTNYESYYDAEDGSCNIVIYPANGQYVDNIIERDVLVKYHLINGCENVEKVTINNETIDYEIVDKNSKLYPFNETKESPVSKTIFFSKTISMDKKYHIKFYIKK